MDSLMERWKDAINNVDSKPSLPPNPQNPRNTEENVLKKSQEKSKRSLHSNEAKIHQSRRTVTPSKKKPKKSKADWIEKYKDEVLVIVGKTDGQKNLSAKIVGILESLWAKASEDCTPQSELQLPSQLEISSMQESTLSATAKKHQKLYHDLQKKYFQCEKERQYLRGKADALVKKYQHVDKQLERYAKMQRLIDNCLEREDEVKQENKRLKQELQLAGLRQIQQQKIFQKQIAVVHQLMDSIRKNLPDQ